MESGYRLKLHASRGVATNVSGQRMVLARKEGQASWCALWKCITTSLKLNIMRVGPVIPRETQLTDEPRAFSMRGEGPEGPSTVLAGRYFAAAVQAFYMCPKHQLPTPALRLMVDRCTSSACADMQSARLSNLQYLGSISGSSVS